jgi:hypothetical protein
VPVSRAPIAARIRAALLPTRAKCSSFAGGTTCFASLNARMSRHPVPEPPGAVGASVRRESARLGATVVRRCAHQGELTLHG